MPLAFGLTQAVVPTAEDDYLNGTPSDSISAMQDRIYSGALKLAYEPKQGFLRAILKELKISSSTQMLVFSKTSLQTHYISSTNPRAIYFNDHTYVGWIKDAANIEIASVDPKRGPIFYTIRKVPQVRPTFVREADNCVTCHDTALTDHVPGLTARSVFAGADGQPRLANGSFLTTYKSPMKERWGGWYVTGKLGAQRQMGNEAATGDEYDSTIDMDKGSNVTDLRPYIEVDKYLTPNSDIVALMVAEHQMEVQNLITKAGYLTRNALRDESIFSPEDYAAGKHSESTLSRIDHACEPLVKALLCIDEAKLTAPVTGTSQFATEYAASAPKDKEGHSLSELDLKTRLLRNPCSPLIYSEAFNDLSPLAKAQVYRRLSEILTAKVAPVPYNQLTDDERKSVLEILKGTKPDFVTAR